MLAVYILPSNLFAPHLVLNSTGWSWPIWVGLVSKEYLHYLNCDLLNSSYALLLIKVLPCDFFQSHRSGQSFSSSYSSLEVTIHSFSPHRLLYQKRTSPEKESRSFLYKLILYKAFFEVIRFIKTNLNYDQLTKKIFRSFWLWKSGVWWCTISISMEVI